MALICIHRHSLAYSQTVVYFCYTAEGVSWTDLVNLSCLRLLLGDPTLSFRGKIKELRVMDIAYSAR